MLRLIFAFALGLHGVGHVLFLANAWGYWKTTTGRAWLFADVLHAPQPLEGMIGLLWIVPLAGFVAATWGFVAHDARWAMLAFSSAVMSTILLLVWWSSLNVSSAFFALVFNVLVIVAILLQRQPDMLGR
ncbi:MAG TPA: hypothetical protein VGD58_03670 [Herpetosiphonaceae bacterium]